MSEATMIYKADGKRIGSVKGETFYKTVQGSKHLYKKLPGWSMDFDVLKQLNDLGVKRMEIKDSEAKKVYSCELKDYASKGESISFGAYGVQRVLALSYFEVK